MKRDLLDRRCFDSLIRTDSVGTAERWLGYFLGPFSVVLMNSILNNYLNVYYTDVAGLGELWDGWFLSVFPIAVKLLDALTFVLMGVVVDRFSSRQGKARPWIFFSAPLLSVSMILLFAVPSGHSLAAALWIFFSYNLFYSVAYTAYNTSHTLMVPLSTRNAAQRSRLSVMTNAQGMLSGTIVAVLFPAFFVPFMGVDQKKWIMVMTIIALGALPFILMEYYFTRERVTEQSRAETLAPSSVLSQEQTPSRTLAERNTNNGRAEKQSLKAQLQLCLRSRRWTALMLYLTLSQLTACLSQSAVFYYCNWVLGSYNDGHTQALYYVVGTFALGPGLLLCRPVCRRLGRENAMAGGFLLAAAGTVLCLWNPKSLFPVLAGQIIRSIGVIPSTYMITAMLADALDDVEEKTGLRCDGFSSSVYNIIFTLTGGLALCILNFGLMRCGYEAPLADKIPVQISAVQSFLVFAAIGCQTLGYPVLAALLQWSKRGSKSTDTKIPE